MTVMQFGTEANIFVAKNDLQLQQATKSNPCPHCGKPDWCYSIGELTVCKRQAEPARGWTKTSKTDREGEPFYAPETQKYHSTFLSKASAVKPKAPDPTPIPAKIPNHPIELAKLPASREVLSRQRKGDRYERIFNYSEHQYVKRIEQENGKKHPACKPKPYYIDANGKERNGKNGEKWQPYRMDEALEYGFGKWISFLEGENCVEALRDLGLVGITNQAADWELDWIIKQLQKLKDSGATGIIYHFDNDTEGQNKAKKVAIASAKVQLPFIELDPVRLWKECPEKGDIVDWIEWGKKQGMETSDFIQRLEEEIHRAVAEKQTQQDEQSAEQLQDQESFTRSKLEQKFNVVRGIWGDRLRWNTLKKQVELDEQWLPLDRLDLKIAREIHIDINKEQAKGIVLELAQERSYSPVVEYLESVAIANPDVDLGILEAIASGYLGTDDPLHAALIKRTLIAAVARSFDPGCKHDTICILQGDQGGLKSTFWSTLAGNAFFSDDISSGTEKDEILKLSQYWILEYAEFETAYKKKEVSQLKAFLSRKSDSIRKPYGTDIEDMPRPSILVGTTNKDEFLHDPTGERRFWVVATKVKKINIAQLKKERDRIWAAAVAAYRSGEQWWLTDAEDELLKAANGQYQSSDPWEDSVLSWANQRREVSLSDILSEALKIEVARQDCKQKMRVAAILSANGWRKGKRRRANNNKRIYPWLKSEVRTQGWDSTQILTQQADQPLLDEKTIQEVGTRLGHPQNLIQQELHLTVPTCPNLFDKTFQNSESSDDRTQQSSEIESFENDKIGWDSKKVEKPETITQQELQMCPNLVSQPNVSPQSFNDPKIVQGNAELLRAAVIKMDWSIIEALTEGWTLEFKQAVWGQLTAAEKEAIKALRPQSPVLKVGDRVQVADETQTRDGMNGVIEKIVDDEAVCDFGTQIGWTQQRLRKPIPLSSLRCVE
ncbi:hypothetical protein H6G04_30100 [Calothrix membranacea FACHB-236]|nr:hypothetical protein [Calothrix membranacea FACHB-236]